MIVLYIVLAIIVILLLVVLIRTLNFKPKKVEAQEFEDVTFNKEQAVSNLAELIKCKTVSHMQHDLEDNKEFVKLIEMLPKLYLNVFKTCEFQRMSDRKLVFKWKGTDGSGDPAVLMAHFDVVPVEEENWTKPAFDALIEDGIMWGRGTLDTKLTFNGILTAADNLIAQGYTPKNDVYFCFSGQEEINGPEAKEIVLWFKEQNITPALVIDEGGAVVQDIFPGVKEPCGLIGIAEKGMTNVTLEIASNGGHASAPRPHSPVPELAKAVCDLESHPFPAHFTTPVSAMFDTLGRHSSFVYRMIFANLWLFRGILDGICKKSGGELNALVRTTMAFTQMKGSSAHNVIPPTASILANFRLNPEDSVEGARQYVEKVINNPNIKVTTSVSNEPSRIADLNSEGWKKVSSAVAGTWKGCIVSPYLMVQCSDSRHYDLITDKTFKFSAMDVTSEEREGIHGNNEHVRLEVVERAVEFFIRVMKQC